MEMYGVSKNRGSLIWNRMKCWRTESTTGNQVLGEWKIKRGIFPEDNVSLLIFVLGMISVSEILLKTKLGNDLGRGKERLNHLLFIRNLKLFTKCEAELDSLAQLDFSPIIL